MFNLLVILFLNTLAAAELKINAHDYPPFCYLENDKLKGAMVEIVQEICKITKDKCIIEYVPLKRNLQYLEMGRIHGVMSLVQSDSRDKFGTLSDPIIYSDLIYASVKTSPILKSKKELNGYRVGVVLGSASSVMVEEQLKEVGGKGVVEIEVNPDIMVKKISSGKYGQKGAIAGSEDVINYYVKKNALPKLKRIFTLKKDAFGIYFSKKNVDQKTIDRFNVAIKQLRDEGKIQPILKKYDVIKAY